MPAISCHSCHRLISDEEKNCPFCGAPQRLERNAQKISGGLFADPTTVVNWIFAINIILYLGSILLDPTEALSFARGFFGFGSPSTKALYVFGLTGGAAWNCNHYWTLITASFLHGSLLHIYFNMSWLRQLGTVMALMLGPSRFLITYVLTGIGGFLASNLWSNAPTIGASCSIFGIMGTLLVFGHRRGGTIGESLKRQIRTWTIIGLLIGFAIPIMNNAGHIGGLITGIVLGYLFPKMENIRESGLLQLIGIAMLVLTLVAFAWNGWVMIGILERYEIMGQFTCG